MSVVGPIAAKKKQAANAAKCFCCSKIASSFNQVAHTDGHQPFAEREVMERWAEDNYSGLMPANLTTLPHFSVSSARSFPKSAGETGITVAPSSANRVL